MKENFLKFSHTLTLATIALIALVPPLFFLPSTTEFFEYNKFTAVLILTAAGFLIWSVKMILEKRTVFTRSPLDIPIIFLLIVSAISSFSSIDQSVSFFGAYGRIWPSALTLATIAACFFLISSNLKTKKNVNIVLWILVCATTIASLIAISSYFGAYLPADFAKLRSFNPLGIINRLAILQVITLDRKSTRLNSSH